MNKKNKINFDELKLWLMPTMSLSEFYKIKKIFGNEISEIFNSTRQELESFRLNQKNIDYILTKQDLMEKRLDDELHKIDRHNIKVISINDEYYPELLKYIHYPPPFLFTKGDEKLLQTDGIGIVGTRYPTEYGRKMADKLAQDLASNKISVISGLARGIDSFAHKGALKTGKTIAVLGNGLGVVYPKENQKLYDEIADKGLIITELPFDMHPEKFNFPLRNRIVSGLSRGVVVIEAGKKSGALITADCAIEQGKDVFAVPGEATNPNAEGTNQLLKDGAKIVLDSGDILEEVFGLSQNFYIEKDKKNKVLEKLDTSEHKIYEFIVKAHKPNFEVIAENFNKENVTINVNVLMAKLLSLELKGIIKELPGKYYCSNF